jgi:SAM-dependent methyltransferase
MDGTAMEQLKKFSQIYLSQNILVSGLSLYRLRNPFLDHFFALPIELLHIKDKYNLIISNFAFCYFSFPNTALQNMLAALKPGGKLVCNISFIPYGCDADITINMINALADYQDSTANFQKQLETRFRHLHIFLDQLSHDKNYIISTTSVTIPDGCGTGIMIEKNDQ